MGSARRLRSGNRGLIREINRALVLGIVRERGPISRTEIARVANLSPATVSGITAEAIADGWIYEQSAGLSTGGRRPTLLALNRAAGFVLGAKLTEEQVVVALTDLGAEIVEQESVALAGGRTPEAVVATIGSAVDRLRTRYPERRILGLGLGMAGVIDRRAGICRFSPFLSWRNAPLGDLLEERIGLPVVLENDVNTLVLAEHWFGVGAGRADFLVVTLGRGVGMGMFLQGQLYRGGCGGGGEFGHVTLEPDGPLCECGKRGCLEALVGEPALLRRFHAALGREVSLAEAVEIARQGEPEVAAVFADAGRTLGLGLAALVNLFNPPLLILGGEGAQALDLLRGPIEAALREHSFDGYVDDLRLVAEPWGDNAWAQGAAGLMLEELFSPALYRDEEARSPRFADGGDGGSRVADSRPRPRAWGA